LCQNYNAFMDQQILQAALAAANAAAQQQNAAAQQPVRPAAPSYGQPSNNHFRPYGQPPRRQFANQPVDELEQLRNELRREMCQEITSLRQQLRDLRQEVRDLRHRQH
jgi:hypothetical protein